MMRLMSHFIAPAVTAFPDDDLPRYPHPGDDALASPQARRYIRSGGDGQLACSVNTETTRRRPLSARPSGRPHRARVPPSALQALTERPNPLTAPANDHPNASTPKEAKRAILDRFEGKIMDRFKGKGNILTPRAKQ